VTDDQSQLQLKTAESAVNFDGTYLIANFDGIGKPSMVVM